MRKITLLILFVLVCVLCVVSVEGALTDEAKIAGYHSILYTGSIDVADDSLNAIAIWPSTFIVGNGGKALWIQGDASGNYIFNTLTGNYVSFPDNVSVGGSLRMAGYGPVISTAGYWTGQPIDSSQVTINTTNNLFARSGSCPPNQVMVGVDSNGATCVIAPRITCVNGQLLTYNSVSSSWVCSSLPSILPSCGVSQYLFWDGSNWVCRAVSANTVLPVCVNGQVLVWNSTISTWDCSSVSETLPSCGVGQVLFWSGAAWGCLTQSSVPSCAAGQLLTWSAVSSSWVCSSLPNVLPVCGGANQVLTWDGSNWVCQVPAVGSNYWTKNGNDIYPTDSNNMLGVGTNNPAFKLDVNGSPGVTPAQVASPDGWLQFGPANALWSHFYTDRPRYYFNRNVTVDNGGIGSYDEDLSLQTSGTTRMTISNSNGNVGIGTAAPTQKLDVVGNIKSSTGVNAPQFCDATGANCIVPTSCVAGQNLIKTATGWSCESLNSAVRGDFNNILQSVPSGCVSGHTIKLNFKNKRLDNLGEYNSATSEFTAKSAGYYFVTGKISTANSNFLNCGYYPITMYLELRKNSVLASHLDYNEEFAEANNFGHSITLKGEDIVYLDANDKLSFYLSTYYNHDEILVGGSPYDSYFTIQRLSTYTAAAPVLCGDGSCNGAEDCTTCPGDCGVCMYCGDSYCYGAEDCSTCPGDCGVCPVCGDGSCDTNEDCGNCPGDCGVCPVCGDGSCNGGEACDSCSVDCGPCSCGDGSCGGADTCGNCPGDCGFCSCSYYNNNKPLCDMAGCSWDWMSDTCY